MNTVELSNLGPVKHLSFDAPSAGLLILRGQNGAGKTKALEAIRSVIAGKGAGNPQVRDDEKTGEISAFGAKIVVGRSARRTGELEVISLEGRMDISMLIDPGLKDPAAQDCRRIKALCALAGAKADVTLFHGLVGGQDVFDRLVTATSAKSDDLVTMAERIKRDLESKARDAEDAAEKADGRVAGGLNAAAGIDVTRESDSAKLQQSHETAVREESRLKAQAEASAKAARAAKLAKDQLEDAEASYSGLSLADANEDESAAKATADGAEKAVRDAEELLRTAKASFESARTHYSAAIQARKTAEQHESMVRQWRDQIAASIPEAPSQSVLETAATAVSSARQALEQGALIRQAKATLAEAEKAKAEAKRQRAASVMLREAAKGTDEVLSGVVGKLGTSLRVEAGRLVTDTDRGATYFDDLSAGEKAKMAIDIGIDAAGKNAVIVFPQEKFEGLSPRNRKMVAEHARERGALIITAVATDDAELTAEVFETETEPAAV